MNGTENENGGKVSKPFTSILVGVTGADELDARLMAMAKQLAGSAETKITAVSVVQPSAINVSGAGASSGTVSITPNVTHAMKQRRMEERRDKVLERLHELDTSDHSQVEIRFGIVNTELVAAAEEHDADLIIVGRRNRSWLGELFAVDSGDEIASMGHVPTIIVPEAD